MPAAPEGKENYLVVNYMKPKEALLRMKKTTDRIGKKAEPRRLAGSVHSTRNTLISKPTAKLLVRYTS